MKLDVSVSADHITRGKRCSAVRCPVALAVQDNLPPRPRWWQQAGKPRVAAGMPVALTYPRGTVTYRVPLEAADFMAAFDARGARVSPFSFTMEEM